MGTRMCSVGLLRIWRAVEDVGPYGYTHDFLGTRMRSVGLQGFGGGMFCLCEIMDAS